MARSRKQHGGQKLPRTCLLLSQVIPALSTVAQPLYKLTEAKTEFVWTGQCQQAFDGLKGLLTSARVLAYPTREGKFVLDTDASDHGIGAVLSQLQDGVERPIAFASRTLSKSERNYCVTRRELLAIVEFVKQHRHYLQGARFSNIEQDNDTRMLMHFLADPAMTVVSGVGVGNLRNKCQLFMWVSRPR